MTTNSKKIVLIAAFPVIPLLVLLFRNFIFFRRGWDTSLDTQYQTIFWAARIILIPILVLYIFNWWVEPVRLFKLLLIQLGCLIGYLFIHFWVSFGLCRILMDMPGNRIWNRTKTIFEDAFTLNMLIYLATVFVFYVWEYFERIKEAEKRALLLEKSLAVSRLEILKNQLNTHFLFNTLHTISSLIMHEEKEEANQTLVKLGHLLRFSLVENKEPFIPVHKEIDLTRIYLDIQKKRFNERLQYQFIYQEIINDILIPTFILQPLVENAIEYAIEPFTEPGKITIILELVRGELVIEVIDTGKQFFEKINFDGGIGIRNTKERLKGLYGSKFSFAIAAVEPGPGTKVTIHLPIENFRNENL
jgi:two-component system LytT family sensor kinase